MMVRNQTRARVIAAAGAVAVGLASPAVAVVAFPGADGFGANSTGGRGGDVYHVTTLSDDAAVVGSLRYGLTAKNVPAAGRTIVFDVGGTIKLGASLDIKDASRITIAGQTAPGPGITLTGNTVQITGSKVAPAGTTHIVMRYLAVRNVTATGADALTVSGSSAGTANISDIIIDHCTAAWGQDENLSVTNSANNVTVSHSFITEGLGGGHQYGSLVRTRRSVANVSYVGNLYANNASRQARPGSYSGFLQNFDFRNNVVYNYSDRAGYTGGDGTAVEQVNMNFVGNYTIAGPVTATKNLGSGYKPSTLAFTADNSGDGVNLGVFAAGNKIDPNGAGQTLSSQLTGTVGVNSVRDGTDTGYGMFAEINAAGAYVPLSEAMKRTSPFAFPSTGTVDADTAYARALASGGTTPWARGASDARVVGEVRTSAGRIYVGTPPGTEFADIQNQAQVSRPAGFDSDNDGMSNVYELTHGLNPAAADNNVFVTAAESATLAGYTFVEMYLNQLTLQAGYAGGANGNWNDLAAWNGAAPVLQDSTAALGPQAGAATVTLAANAHVGVLSFDSAAGYTLANAPASAAGGLTMDVLTHNGVGFASVVVASGSHTVAVPVTLATNTRVITQPGTTLQLTGGLTTGGKTLTKQGGGTLRATPSAYTNLLTDTGGIDLQGGRLVLDYGTAASPVSQIKTILTNGYAGHFAAGQLRSTGLAAGLTLGYGDDGAGVVTIMVTLPGDADLNGQVDFNDFLALQNHFGEAATRFDQGNFNYDGATDFNDFLALQNNFGQSLTGARVNFTAQQVAALTSFAQSAGVPEPMNLGLLSLTATRLLKRHRR